MKKLLSLLLLMPVLMAQATTPTTRPASTAPSIATTARTIDNPVLEAVVASMPANLWPKDKETVEDVVARSAITREWDAKNVTGKVLTFEADVKTDTLWFRLDSRPKTLVEIVLIGNRSIAGKRVKVTATAGPGGFTIWKLGDESVVHFSFKDAKVEVLE